MTLWGLWQGCSSQEVIFLFLQPEPWKEGLCDGLIWDP